MKELRPAALALKLKLEEIETQFTPAAAPVVVEIRIFGIRA